jgi:2'-5' RNA ligase
LRSEDNTRRIFVSIPVPEKIKEEIVRFRQANQSVKGLVWTKENNLHITVYFIGNIKQENFPAVVEIVRDVVAVEESFSLEFEKISLAPSSEKPRMVWLRFSRHDLFTDLATRIHLSLRKFIPENPFYFRDPIPHITLTRFNSTFDTSRIKLDLALEIPVISVKHCELWESIQTDEGARYISIEKFSMRVLS